MELTIHNQDWFPIQFTTRKFSGGEVQVRVEGRNVAKKDVWISSNIASSDDLMEVLLYTDALRRMGTKSISLQCPYLPYARQDRVCYEGEALSIKVLCDIINAQNYKKVEVWDVHSDVALALLNNVDHEDVCSLISWIPPLSEEKITLVAPDAGALKKVQKVSQLYKIPAITASKIRNPENGEITGTKVDTTYRGHKNFLIVDDICDGGKTFTELAKELRSYQSPDSKIYLYVTHGIFSKGFDPFFGVIDEIYVSNSFKDDVPLFVHKMEDL